jgi:hypothetical protein
LLYRVFEMSTLTLLFLLLCCHYAVAESTGKLIGDLRIVGGYNAKEYPTYAASGGSRLCGGVLIHKEYDFTHIDWRTKEDLSDHFFAFVQRFYILAAVVLY